MPYGHFYVIKLMKAHIFLVYSFSMKQLFLGIKIEIFLFL